MIRFHRFATTCLSLLCLGLGCATTLPDREVRMTRSYVYYLDGAGGGGPISNWGRGVRQGFLDAGYDGAGEMFRWQTGLGVVADQDASVEYKRGKAALLAYRIQQYRNEHPGTPVSLIGLSAGTAVAVFTLEALPASVQVDDVVLLGASISDDYDLTRALARVRHRMYVFTSEHDAVLAYLVPMSGTADRREGAAAGLSGFQMPAHASPEVQRQYVKLSHIPWRPEFERYGDFGAHTDTVKAPFVQAYIAPLIIQADARRVRPSIASAVQNVRNPDYLRWSAFAPGASATFDGYQTLNGVRRHIQLTAKLVSKHENMLVIERTYVPFEGKSRGPVQVQHFFVPARIKPGDHPLTHPSTRIMRLADVRLTVAGRPLVCEARTVQARGEFPEWGRDLTLHAATSGHVPGGVVQVDLKSHKENQPFEFAGRVVAYAEKAASPRHDR